MNICSVYQSQMHLQTSDLTGKALPVLGAFAPSCALLSLTARPAAAGREASRDANGHLGASPAAPSRSFISPGRLQNTACARPIGRHSCHSLPAPALRSERLFGGSVPRSSACVGSWHSEPSCFITSFQSPMSAFTRPCLYKCSCANDGSGRRGGEVVGRHRARTALCPLLVIPSGLHVGCHRFKNH